MKVVILAGGMGTRLSEETSTRPKPMVEIGGKPLIWHVMKIYSHYGYNDFVICLGYMGHVIKEYFANYALHMSDVTIDMGRNETISHKLKAEPWRVTLVDTGLTSGTAERVLAVESYLDDTFLLTYGDGIADIDIRKLVAFHICHGRPATISVYQPDLKFGNVEVNDKGEVVSFREKPPSGGWINCGFMVLQKAALEPLRGSQHIESKPLETMAREGHLMAYQHNGFWQCMDTLREKTILQDHWNTGKAPWKVWNE